MMQLNVEFNAFRTTYHYNSFKVLFLFFFLVFSPRTRSIKCIYTLSGFNILQCHTNRKRRSLFFSLFLGFSFFFLSHFVGAPNPASHLFQHGFWCFFCFSTQRPRSTSKRKKYDQFRGIGPS